MRSYTDTSSQQSRQYDATAALDAANTAARRAASVAHIRAAYQAHLAESAAREQLEAAHDFASVHTGIEYERFVAAILTSAGHSVVRVGSSGDYGADLIAETKSGVAVIQCKFYSNPVGYDAVKEACTAKAIYHATAAFVVSNAAFTAQARKAARQLGVTFANRAEIAALLKTL